MPRINFLSYSIDEHGPVYPGDLPVSIAKVRDIKKHDSCNTSLVMLSNHAGTHLDTPRHFFEKGKTIREYRPSELRFTEPYLIDCHKRSGEAIKPADLELRGKEKQADIVLLRTGFGRYRAKDPEAYCRDNPFISPQAARCMIRNFPRIKAVGIDTISISTRKNSNLGKESHKILLGKGILIIEDMFFPHDIKNTIEINVFPVFKGCPDGSPCVVVGVQDD